MKTTRTDLNLLAQKLLAAVALAAFAAAAVQAALAYDFNGGSLQGWHNRVWEPGMSESFHP